MGQSSARLTERKDAIDHRVHLMLGQYAIHILEVAATAHSDRAQCGAIPKELHQVDVFAGRGEIANERDPTSIRESLCRLRERSGAADLHHEIHTAAASEPLYFGTPCRSIDVVHDVLDTEFGEPR